MNKPPPQFRFQIVTETEQQAAQFMKAAAATDVAIEEWEGHIASEPFKRECFGFGTTRRMPKRLVRIADAMEIDLVYIERDEWDSLETMAQKLQHVQNQSQRASAF